MSKPAAHVKVTADEINNSVIVGDFAGSIHIDGARDKSVTPQQLPIRPPACVGRAGELAALDCPARITLLVGPGGIGKTCLAVWWAYERREAFPDGQLFVDLHGFSPNQPPRDPVDVLGEFLGALGVRAEDRPEGCDARAAQFRSLVATRRLLVVLDNAADAAQVEPLLPGGPDCRVVITSRNRLRRITTKHDGALSVLDVLSVDSARKLLAARVGAERVEAEPDTTDELIAHCGGYPLALTIVAGQARCAPALAAVSAGLRDTASRLRALDDEDDAEISFRAVLSWSLRALPPRRAVVFAQLGVAAGPDIGLAAAASLTGLSTEDTSAELARLVGVSLIQEHTAGRWRMHDLVRLIATEQVVDELAAARRRLIDFYLHTAMGGDRALCERVTRDDLAPPAEGCQPSKFTVPDGAREWFKAEHLCLLAAQQEAARQRWWLEVCQFARALDTFHRWNGRLHDNLETWRAALKASDNVDDPILRSRCNRMLGDAYTLLGLPGMALPRLHHALAVATQAGDPQSEASCHNALARAFDVQGDHVSGRHHAQEMLRKQRCLDNELGIAVALSTVGVFDFRLHDMTAAHDNCLDALARFQALGFRPGIATMFGSLGDINLELGQYFRALEYYRKGVDLAVELEDVCTEADCRTDMGRAYLRADDVDGAVREWQRALELRRVQNRGDEVERLTKELAALGVAESAT
ncbi:ATP-binding protein [Kutzneria sp. NPDC052558]|uniref:ATP-binding protein n=1 Tax=Kutzneria sp. NPDC052558 TaxID=3364121 RepID=UPI0037CC97FE